jgi:hypothetical protein
MIAKFNSEIAVIGIDIGKNSFHIVGLDRRGAIVLRQKWSRGQVETRLANLPPCLIGMEHVEVGGKVSNFEQTGLSRATRMRFISNPGRIKHDQVDRCCLCSDLGVIGTGFSTHTPPSAGRTGH